MVVLEKVDDYDEFGGGRWETLSTRTDNESNQLENSSILDSIIGSLDLVHEPNESNLS
ncbi:hypothetical protein MTR_7g071975 [Medicago truncatula]|uniref:Uncharacterized protein n=1 Tax=Medicago truncatula TaxID=3880 RepID=A0A072U0D0_MEDTR|nr:hypothetical protein MTR_7g071975 [Medicago truncatula]